MKILFKLKKLMPVLPALGALMIMACGAGNLGFSGVDINDFDGSDDDTSGDGPNVNSTPGFSALVLTDAFGAGAEGANCATSGGVKLRWGLDNGDGTGIAGNFILETGEIDKTEYICNGDDGAAGTGFNSLISSSSFVAGAEGANCAATGGVKITSGLDNGDGGATPDDGILSLGEIDKTEYICNGLAGSNGIDGYSSLISSSSFLPGGANCNLTGGSKISFGLDNGDGAGNPGDGILHIDEVDSTEYICNGSTGPAGADGADGTDGINSLVKVTAEPAGVNCAEGGNKIQSGLDDDNDGVLDDPAEIDSTVYACNGIEGPAGSDGTDGLNSLVKLTAEPAGGNCANGGQKIQSGLDDDDDGVLDDPVEVDSTSYACNGIDGADGGDGLNSLVKVTAEPAGVNCTEGGQKVQSGVDDDDDGILDDPAEIDSTAYVCDGSNGGVDGLNSLVKVTAEPAGGNCANGGQKIQSGLDDDEDGVLDDPAEIDATAYACNGIDGAVGADGLISLVKITAEPAGGNCANGGQKVQSGVDDDDDGILDDPAEIDSTAYACNGVAGADGADGADGLNSLVKVTAEPAGVNCTDGGQKVQSGIDDDDDGILDDPAEVDSTAYVCNGVDGADGVDGTDGLNSLVKVTAEPAGGNCANGGQKVQSGVDDDDDGILDDPAEVDSTSYVCNGATGPAGADGSDGTDGLNSLVKLSAEPAGVNCTYGGQKVQSGLDDDKDGVLDDPAEIDFTTYVCNGAPGVDGADGADGADGVNSLITITAESAGVNCSYGGKRIDSGIDNGDGGGTSGNNTLESGEIDVTAYICNTGQAVLYQNNTDIGNAAGVETTLGTYTIPASTLARNGDYIEFDSVLVTAANNNSKRVRAYFGATLIYDSTAATNTVNNVTIRVHGKIYRTAAATQRSATDSTCSATAWNRSVYAAPAETLTNAIVIRITGLGTAANDVTSRTFEVGLGVAP